MDYDDDNDNDKRKEENGDDDDDNDNDSTIQVNTSTVCSKIPIPTTIDTSSTSEDNMNPITSSTTAGSSERYSKSCFRGKRNGSSSYVRKNDITIDHLEDLILALETVCQFFGRIKEFTFLSRDLSFDLFPLIHFSSISFFLSFFLSDCVCMCVPVCFDSSLFAIFWLRLCRQGPKCAVMS